MLLARPTLMLWSAMILAVLASALPTAPRAQDAPDIGALNKQVRQLHLDRKSAEAMPIAEQTLALAERTLGADHPDTLSSVENLADLYYDQGRETEAETLYRRVLEARERVLGPDDPDTLVSLNDLGGFLQTQGRNNEAEPLIRRGVEARGRVLGPDHADTLESVSYLAALYNAQSRYDEAEPLFKRALEARERVLGPEHANTIASIKDLANFYQARGRQSEAEPLMRRGFEISERVLGRDHPDTLSFIPSLGQLYVTQSRYAEAEPFVKRGVELLEHRLGREHPNTLAMVSSLAWIYRIQNRHSEAAPLLRRVLDVQERGLGKDNPDTLATLVNLAVVYKDERRYEEAEPLFTRAIEARQRVLGGDAPDTIAAVINLAELYRDQSRYNDAEPLLRRVLEARERVLGKEHADTLFSVDGLATLYRLKGRYGEAEPLYRRALEARARILGGEHRDALTSTSNLAALYRMQGRYSEAEPLYQNAVDVAERVLGQEDEQTLLSLNNLADLYVAEGRYGEVEPLLKRVLESFERQLGKEHRRTLTSVNNLATIYNHQRRYSEAEPLYQRALEASERVLGREHPDTLAIVNNLADVYFQQNRHGDAELLYKRALEARERALGAEHPDTLISVNNLAWLYKDQGRHGEAEVLYRRAMEGATRVLGGEHPQTLASISNLGDLYFAQRDWTRAAQFLRRSTAAVIERTRRSTLDPGQGLIGRQRSDAEQASLQFSGLVKAIHRLKKQSSATALETFQTAQWALSSEAARSLAQMSARGASGDPQLAALARERQDLADEWQTRDATRNAALGAAPDKRNAKAEAENRDRLAVIDARIAAIDKRLTAEFPDYAALASPVPLPVEEVQAQLGADEALVLFLDTKEDKPTAEETFIWVVTKTKLRWVRSDLGTEALTRDVQALRCGLDEEEWATATNARRCGDLLGLADMPDGSRPLPFSLGKAHALYKALFGEIEELIAGKRLLIVPSGALTGLPFQVLVTKKPKVALPRTFEAYRDIAWLGRRNAITTLPAVSSLKALRQHAADRRPATEAYAGFGNPLLSGDGGSCRSANTPAACPSLDAARRRTALGVIERATVRGNGGSRNAGANMDQVFTNGSTPVALLGQVRGLCPLADTAYEINCIAERFKGKSPLIRLAGEATEANIKALSQSGQLARYRVLHLATHGLLSGDVERMAQRQGEPALVLSPPDRPAGDGDDGLLMASEVAALKLNADWVVLSACNTAAGDQIGGQALSGLARAFFYAGGRTLLVSHWPVYSDAAVRLTTRAFAELDRDPKAGRAEALRKAMTALMDDRSQTDNAHPAVWAPFIVVGEGGDAPPGRQPRAKR